MVQQKPDHEFLVVLQRDLQRVKEVHSESDSARGCCPRDRGQEGIDKHSGDIDMPVLGGEHHGRLVWAPFGVRKGDEIRNVVDICLHDPKIAVGCGDLHGGGTVGIADFRYRRDEGTVGEDVIGYGGEIVFGGKG